MACRSAQPPTGKDAFSTLQPICKPPDAVIGAAPA
jgi:hypothetical protein